MPKPMKKEEKVVVSAPKAVETKEEVAELSKVEKLEKMIRPKMNEARALGTHAYDIFISEFSSWIKEWKDLTGKQFPADF